MINPSEVFEWNNEDFLTPGIEKVVFEIFTNKSINITAIYKKEPRFNSHPPLIAEKIVNILSDKFGRFEQNFILYTAINDKIYMLSTIYDEILLNLNKSFYSSSSSTITLK
jgi:F0F1-type ATP synthase delta subunit